MSCGHCVARVKQDARGCARSAGGQCRDRQRIGLVRIAAVTTPERSQRGERRRLSRARYGRSGTDGHDDVGGGGRRTAASAASQSARREQLRIPVTGMTCAACQARVQRALAQQPGVEDASVNLMMANAAVTFDPRRRHARTQLVQAIRDTGYGAELPAMRSSAFEEQEARDRSQREELRSLRARRSRAASRPCSRCCCPMLAPMLRSARDRVSARAARARVRR